MGLQPGMQMSMRDLLYGLLLPSGNDAAIAIAEHVAGSVPAFVELMNAKAGELELRNTHFANPHGLDDPDHYTSAHDIAVFGRELLRRPELAEIVRSMEYQPAWDRPAFSNGNRLLFDYPESIGIKIGFTDEAGQTIVAAAERGGRRIIVSVLGSSTVYQDAVALFEWAFSDTTSACRGLGGQGG
jgi:D-alanyl-D-alanine carboxypeptidase